MTKYVIITVLTLFLTIPTKAQVIVKWDELNRDWFINSSGYPSEEPSLDSLYYKLHDFQLMLKPGGTYKMIFSKDKFDTGKYEIDKTKRELVLTVDKTGQKLAYSVAELTPDVLILTIGEKYTWAYYLSLTSHQ
jgi:hypothetical protein